jgi:hypothetical protein
VRAATLIVGAIAVASCLIAAALVLSNRDSGPRRLVVHERPMAAEARIEERFQQEAEVAQSGTPTVCNDQVSAGPNTSCGLGLNVWKAYRSTGGSEISAVSPVNGSTYRFHCAGTAPTICSGSRGATVYIGS